MAKLGDIFNYDLLLCMRVEGYVREQTHPTEPLTILNYTEKAQFDKVWNPVTRACRGLIYNPITGDVIARPFEKFFNYGEEQIDFDLDESCRVFDKMDGSLGIMYPCDGMYAIATRGSFTSEQAMRATAVLRQKYHPFKGWDPYENHTYLFEIIYPENRIVVDYGQETDLYLLDVINNETGEQGIDFSYNYPGPWVEEFDYETFGAALAAEPRPNAEGFVVFFPQRNERVKIKQEDYVKLHRIVTGLNERTIWEHLKSGGDVSALVDNCPDEFHQWIRDTAYDLLLLKEKMQLGYQEDFYAVKEELGDCDRKTFALAIQDCPHKWALFSLLDGKDIEEEIWKQLKPEANSSPIRLLNEDAA